MNEQPAESVAIKACCWKHVWHIPGCWRCEAREWRRKKDAAQHDGDEC
jgi:hypothetical protein